MVIANADKQLHSAAAENDVQGIREALAAGAKTETRDGDGRTPLMAAVYHNHINAAKLLIENGANVNAQDKILNSPFLYAGASGFTEIVKMCMKAGADYKVYNRYGGSALIPACEHGPRGNRGRPAVRQKFPGRSYQPVGLDRPARSHHSWQRQPGAHTGCKNAHSRRRQCEYR